MGVLGFSFAGNGQNMAMAFVRLKDWSERQDPSLKVDAVSKRAMAAFSKIRNAQVFAFAPPAIWNSATRPVSTSSCRTSPASGMRRFCGP